VRLPLDTSIAEATAGILCLVAAFGVLLYYLRHPLERGRR
jgi:hypothetical protein